MISSRHTNPTIPADQGRDHLRPKDHASEWTCLSRGPLTMSRTSEVYQRVLWLGVLSSYPIVAVAVTSMPFSPCRLSAHADLACFCGCRAHESILNSDPSGEDGGPRPLPACRYVSPCFSSRRTNVVVTSLKRIKVVNAHLENVLWTSTCTSNPGASAILPVMTACAL